MSGSGFVIQPVSNVGAPLTMYGGIVDNTEAFRSIHAQAVSVSDATRPQAGVHQSPDGHPSHGEAISRCGGLGGAGSDSSSDTP